VKTQKQLLPSFLMLLMTSAFLLNGCSSSERTPVVTINDKNLYMEDFLYDIYVIESEGNQLEEYYQSKLGYGYWDYEYEGSTMRETAKSSVLTRVVMNEILADQAEKNGFTLTKKELTANKDTIDALIQTSSEEAFHEIGITRDILNTAYNKISLSDKYYIELSNAFKIDEASIRNSLVKEDYLEYKTECLFIPTVAAKNQTLTPLTEGEIKTSLTTITDVLTKVEDGSEFDTLLNEYDSLTYYTRNFRYGDSIYEEAYQDAAITLTNGDYSTLVTTNYGYYIIHMLDTNSTDQYEKAVVNAFKLEEDTQFAVLYNEIKTQYDITIDFDYWDTISIGSITSPKSN
jgi:foldase protein PrsA